MSRRWNKDKKEYESANMLDNFRNYSYHHVLVAVRNTTQIKNLLDKSADDINSIIDKAIGEKIVNNGIIITNSTRSSNYFIDNIVSNAVFVRDTDSDNGKHLHSAGIRVITLPEEPYDQIVGLALYAKLNAIMEQRMFITDCEISSRNGRHVSYMHAAEESIGPFELPGWWNDSGLTFCNKKLLARDKKVVKLVKSEDSWRNFNLDWEAGAEEPGESNVVVVKFDHEKE